MDPTAAPGSSGPRYLKNMLGKRANMTAEDHENAILEVPNGPRAANRRAHHRVAATRLRAEAHNQTVAAVHRQGELKAFAGEQAVRAQRLDTQVPIIEDILKKAGASEDSIDNAVDQFMVRGDMSEALRIGTAGLNIAAGQEDAAQARSKRIGDSEDIHNFVTRQFGDAGDKAIEVGMVAKSVKEGRTSLANGKREVTAILSGSDSPTESELRARRREVRDENREGRNKIHDARDIASETLTQLKESIPKDEETGERGAPTEAQMRQGAEDAFEEWGELWGDDATGEEIDVVKARIRKEFGF